MNKQHILAIIPARGGSKRIPRKNIKILAGKPLISYTIKAAQKSKYLNRIVVSTEDREIASIARRYGAEVIMRPKSLAIDAASTIAVLQHAVSYLEQTEKYFPDIIVILQPTSPLRNSGDIDSAICKLIDENGDSAETFCLVKEHPASMFQIKKGRAFPINKHDLAKRAQDLPKLYRENGAVYAVRRDLLMKTGTVYGKKHIPVIMPAERSIDIDEELDFRIAELLMKETKSQHQTFTARTRFYERKNEKQD